MTQVVNPQLYQLIEQVVTAEGLELVHCEFSGGYKQAILRVFIDRPPQGVTHQDCSFISGQLGAVLDVEDLISHKYVLEVSSPGVDRGLYKQSDYVRFAGEQIKLKTLQPIDGRRNFRGRLLGIEAEQVKLTDPSTGVVWLIPFDQIASANIEVDVEELFRRAEHPQP